MQSRKDQVQAHSFVMGRLTSAMLRVDIDGPDQPVPRTGMGTLGGLALAIVIGIVVALFGVIVPAKNNNSWAANGVLAIDSATGARYLYVDGTLRPALNVTSARLVAGNQLTIKTVGSGDLSGTTLGPPFGIVGAPDAVPAAGSLSTGAWSACAAGTGLAGGARNPVLALAVGRTVATSGLTLTQGVVVAGPDGTTYLLWDGRRLRMAAGSGVLAALGYGTVVPTAVPASFLDAVPQGPDLVPPGIDGLGTPGPVLAGSPSRVGQLFSDSTGKHYVLTRQGLGPLSATLFALLSGDPQTQQRAYAGGAVVAPVLGPDDLTQYVTANTALASAAAAFPPAPPRAMQVRDQQAVCVTLQPGTGVVTDGIGLSTVDDALAGARPPGTGTGIVPSCRQADLVSVQPGGGAVVTVAPAGGGVALTDYLVADNGVKFPVPSSAALGQLGYSGSSQVELPATVLSLLPTGPSLDPAALTAGGVVTPPPQPASCE